MQDISQAYPLLDVVDHEKCYAVAKLPIVDSQHLPLVETVIVCGEPKHWETPLQLLIDLLLTNGRPSQKSVRSVHQTLPLIVCNPDLHYMGRSHLPRFGNGAFLVCLEALFKKVTGNDLQYTAVVGKPSEVSYRYAEHCLRKHAHEISSHSEPLKRFYMIGDNAEVDVLGANLYQRYIAGAAVPASRTMPDDARLLPQTVTSVIPILVMTGVHSSYSSQSRGTPAVQNHCQSHRDFMNSAEELFHPAVKVDNVYDAVQYIIEQEAVA